MHQIFDAYQRIIYINNGLSIVQKLHVQCDSLKPICLLLTANKVPPPVFLNVIVYKTVIENYTIPLTLENGQKNNVTRGNFSNYLSIFLFLANCII